MPKERTARIKEWEFTPAELLAAQAMPLLTYQYIQTHVAQLALERSTIAFDPSRSVEETIRAAEFMRGQMMILMQLLDEADEAYQNLGALYADDKEVDVHSSSPFEPTSTPGQN